MQLVLQRFFLITSSNWKWHKIIFELVFTFRVVMYVARYCHIKIKTKPANAIQENERSIPFFNTLAQISKKSRDTIIVGVAKQVINYNKIYSLSKKIPIEFSSGSIMCQ